ncbi:MAG: prepilin-type N-terminal cleavage/methylation domain-containing protein [Candidatus Omnitrophica bacterium]|nr:prepilin-type N-terminal cleavage/methylation domain-containing protein [Candidatus Omnitrophota bacterium]
MASDRRGFSLVELMLAVGITVVLFSVVFGLLGVAQSGFHNTDAGLAIRDDLRTAFQKMEWDIKHTGYDSTGTAQFSILTGTGTNGSDIIRFSIPVVCDSASVFLNSTGTPAHWGASRTWGCDSYTCMDGDGSCSTVEYKYIQYSLNSSKQIVRSVLSAFFGTVSSQIVAGDITDLRISQSGSRTVVLAIAAEKKSAQGRMVTSSLNEKIRLMN